MESRIKLLGHPLHPILIVFPLGLLSTGTIFDLLAILTGNRDHARVAKAMIGAGIVGGMVAAPFGTIDWLATPNDTRAKQVGLVHGVGNQIVLVLYILSWLLRRSHADKPGAGAVTLSFAASGLSLGTAWLGGELVHRLGVSVDDGANLDAPNSLAAGNTSPDTPGVDITLPEGVKKQLINE